MGMRQGAERIRRTRWERSVWEEWKSDGRKLKQARKT